MRRVLLVVPVIGLSLLLSACGNTKDAPTPSPTPTSGLVQNAPSGPPKVITGPTQPAPTFTPSPSASVTPDVSK